MGFLADEMKKPQWNHSAVEWSESAPEYKWTNGHEIDNQGMLDFLADNIAAGTGAFMETGANWLLDHMDPDAAANSYDLNWIKNTGHNMKFYNSHNYEPGSAKYYASALLQSVPEAAFDTAASIGAGAAASAALGPEAAAAGGVVKGLMSGAKWAKKAIDFYNGTSKAAKAARFLTPSLTAKNVPAFVASLGTGRALESAFEGQRAMDEYIEDAKRNGTYEPGRTEEIARDLRDKVARDNALWLTGTDSIQDLMLWGSGRGWKNAARRLLTSAGVEGLEEAGQQIIPKYERGASWHWNDPDVVEAATLGALGGGILHAGGRGVRAILPSAYGGTELEEAQAIGDSARNTNAGQSAPRMSSASYGSAELDEAKNIINQAQAPTPDYSEAGNTTQYDTSTPEESTGSGEGVTWKPQTGSVSLEGTTDATRGGLEALAKWFYDRTGHPLIVTSGTDGTRHKDQPRGHYYGHKVDVNDYGSGAEGTLLGVDGGKGTLTDEFIAYGQSLGLGMNWEGDHIDVSSLGDQWEGPYAGQNFGGFNGKTQSINREDEDFDDDDDFDDDNGDYSSGVDVSNRTYGNIAMAISQRTGFPADWIWAQLAHETGGFESALAGEHNYGGVKGAWNEIGHDSNGHSYFASDEDFIDYMSKYLKKYEEDGIYEAKTMEDYARALKHGGYFTADVDDYIAGMKRHLGGDGSVGGVGSAKKSAKKRSTSSSRMDTSTEDAQLAQNMKDWDEFAKEGKESPFKAYEEDDEFSDKELVQVAKERAIDANDMDALQEIEKARRAGDTAKLAKIAEHERKLKEKAVKAKSAKEAMKKQQIETSTEEASKTAQPIETKTPNMDNIRKRANEAMAKAGSQNDTATMTQIAKALADSDPNTINRIADKLGVPEVLETQKATAKAIEDVNDIVKRALDAGVKMNREQVEQTIAQGNADDINKLYNYMQYELSKQQPSATEAKTAEPKAGTLQKLALDLTPEGQRTAGYTKRAIQQAAQEGFKPVVGEQAIVSPNGAKYMLPTKAMAEFNQHYEKQSKPAFKETSANTAEGSVVPQEKQVVTPKEESTTPQEISHNTITDLQKAVKGRGRKALTKALEAGYKPVDGENAIESPEGEKYYLNEVATKAFAKDYKAKQAKETPVAEKEPEKAEAEQEQAKPEKKLHRVRRGREEIEAVAKKYENGEITAKEAYSQVSAIAKEIATVPKDGLPNVTYIDGKMKLDLTDYGDRLIDEVASSKQENQAETSNDKVEETEIKEVADNEQQGTGASVDGGHGDVESGGSGENESERAGEVSGRDGREGTPVRGDDGEEHSNESKSVGVRAGTELETPASERTDKRGNQPEVSLTEAEAHPSPTETPGHNYEIKDTDVSTKSEKVRFKQNVGAIKLLKQLEADDRMPTPAEQEILGAYNGWGGLKDAFLDGNEMNKELRELLTDEEYKAARSTINDAFYTPPKIIRAIWEGVSHLGFKGGRVLDPSMGVGNFFGTMPRAMMDKSMLRGVEIDSLTSRLGKMLYPNAFIDNKGFQKAEAADNFYDLVISNIPFGQNMIDGYQIHNYFFANGMDKVRPGGLMVYITSQGSLAGGKDAVRMRNYLDKQADLIAAYKLPSGVFSDAGTQVATDIVVFRKHDADGKKSPYAQKFTEVKPVESGSGFYTRKLYDINEYFDKHRENILGETSAGKDQWGNPSLNVKMAQGTTVADVAGDLENAMKKLPKDVYAPVTRKKAKAFDPAAASKRAMADEKTRDYEYYFKDGEPVQNQNGKEMPLTGKKAKIVGDYIKLKNTLNALFAAESDPKAANKDVEGLRKRLNKDYDAFVAKHGQLTGAAASSFNDDPSAGMVQALEKPIEETYTDKRGNERKRVVGAEKADIFTTRSIKPVQEVTHVETADDALIASLTNRGSVDVDYMAKLMGSKPEQVISKLKGKLFQDPVSEEYETRDEYLSGNVREKLAQAKEAAKENKAYENNVKELEKVIPEDLVSDEIYVNLGTPWIPVQDVQAFVDSLANNITVKFSRGAALWNVSGWGSSAKYKLKGITFGELLDHVLNNKAIQIFDGNGEDKVFNQEKTDAANVAAEELQQDFKDWIWKDKEREKRLVKYYNDNYNNTVVRQYNGQHLNLHNYGMNAKINLKPHQKDVVWRMLQGGNTLIAHCVGAGKTFEMQAAGMEMRRLGIANKPMYCLPNNVVEQFAREFRVLYPNAKLLVLQSNDLPAVEKTSRVEKTEDGRTKRVNLLEGKSEKQKAAIMAKRTARNRMLNRIRTEDWDGIIISHNLFQRFPVNPETAADFIQQEIDTLEQTIREAKQDKMDSRALSNLETSKKNLQERLDEVISTDIEDIGVPFEELGIDQLFVDEADMFKNLAFATRLGNIRGLSNSRANRSQDMFLKTQWLTNNMGGRGVVFATGTPVSNTMSELYTMMRYLDMNGLKEKGLEVFDNWMRTFGDIGQGIERKPTGDGFRKVTMIKRFINMAELTKMFRKFADVKVQDELNLDIPKLKNDKTTVIALDPDEKVVNYIKNVVPERVKKMKNGFKKEKGEDNMLSLTNDLRKLSLTDSKIEACADAIAKKYHDTTDVKGTQLVFCDMGIPKAENEKASGEGTATTFDVESPEVYRTLIAKLKEKGIPDKDIAFIQNYNTKTKRDEVFQKVNNDEIRILIGSTETMGAGTNCQTHLVALHDLDAPWRPRDLEQRHGRILRQGNENKEVEIFNYVVKDSFDANMWEKLKNKAAIIQQAMSGDMNMRTVEDADLVTLSYAEVEGAATGNPLIKEQLQVQNDLTKYQHAQTAFRKKVRDAENVLDGHEDRIAEQEKVIGKIEKDIAARKDTSGDNFSMLVGNKGYKERAKAQEALDKILKVFNRHQAMDIGKIGGFRLSAVYDDVNGVKLQLVNNRAYRVQTNSVRGIENALQKAPDAALETRQNDLDSYKKEIVQAKEIVEQENPYAEKVKTLSDRLNQLNREIEATLVDDGKQKAAKAEYASIDSEPEAEAQETAKEETPKAEKEEQNTESAEKNLGSDHIIVGTVPPAGKSTANVEVDEFEHTKTGKMIPAARLRDNVPKNFRKQATAIAKNHGGKWSPFAKRILFKTEQGRDDFVREVEALLSVTKPESSGAIEVKFSQEGWHGSKYHFDKFDVTKIGTGEGAQAHGYGLYIASNRKVSEGYRDKLSEHIWKTDKHTYTQPNPNSIVDERGNEVDYSIRLALTYLAIDGNKNAAIESLLDGINNPTPYSEPANESKKAIEWLKKNDVEMIHQGALYQVEIPDNDVLLDEKKPLKMQPEKVQKAIRDILQNEIRHDLYSYREENGEYVLYKRGKEIDRYDDEDAAIQAVEENNEEVDYQIEKAFSDIENKWGQTIYEGLSTMMGGDKEASELLNQYGIKGITYVGWQDGRCFVVFDDQAVEIINKFSATGEIRRAIERATVVDNDDLTPQQRKMSEFGKEMGTPILWIDTDPNMHGYHAPDGTTVLNARSNMPLSQVFWHESFHWIANNNPELYQELTSYFKGNDAFASKQLEAYRNRIGRPEMSDELTIEEMLADNFEEVKNRVKIFKEMGAEQPSLARKFVAWVKRIMDKFAEFFHNPEGKLTTSQRDSFVKAFGRLARDMKDGEGRPLFKVYKEGKEIKLPNGRLVTDGIKLSTKNDVDKAEKVGDNVSKEVFDKYLTKGIMSMVRDTVTKEIGDNVDLSQMRDPIKRDETRDTLPYIKDLEVKYNQLVGMKAKQEYLDRLATKIEYARRCFDNDKRIRNEAVRPLVGNEGQSRVYQADDAAISRSGRKEGQRDGGRAGVSRTVSGGRRSSREHFEKLYNDMEKHSEKGAFSNGRTKYSYSSSDNSNEGLFHRIKNKVLGADTDSAKFRYRKHLTEMIEKALDVKLRYGKMNGNKSKVVYKPEDRVLRSRHAFDWENILPVAGRVAAEKLGINNSSEEMHNYIATWIITGAPNNVSQEADMFHKAMREHPAEAAKLEDLRDSFAEWMNKEYKEQMQGSISWDNKEDKANWKVWRKEVRESLYEEFVEELEPINRMVKRVNAGLKEKGKDKLSVSIDPMIAFRLSRGSYGRAIAAIEGVNQSAVRGLQKQFPNIDFKGFKTIYQILKSIDAFQDRERQRDFITYCTACHIMDMHEHNDNIHLEQEHLKRKIDRIKGQENTEKRVKELQKQIKALDDEIMPIPAAYTKENCQKYIDDGYDKYNKAQQDLVHFSNTMAAILADSGVISAQRYKELLSKWQNYVPMFRVFEDNEDINFGDSMKHIKGSTRDIVNPLESIIRNTAQFVQKAEMNRAKCLLADVARCDASGWLIEEVDKGDNDKTTVTFYEDGQRKYLQTDPEIVKAINNMGRGSVDNFTAVMHAITRLARACFTMASPEFAVRNVVRDWGDASLYTKYGVWVNPIDIVKGFMHAVRRDNVYYEWLTSGAAQASALSLDRNYTQSTIDKLGRSYWKRLTSKDFFGAVLEGLQMAGEYSEYGTRLAMYQKTKNAILKDKKNATKEELRDAMIEAAFESRDFMDFARHGKAGQAWNKYAAFANASIQGWDKLARSLDFKQDPKRATRTMAKLMLFSVLPAMMLFMTYKDDDWYKEAPEWLKSTHWLFKVGDTVIRVPKANDVGIRFLSYAVERGLNESYRKEPTKLKEYLRPLQDALPGILPTALLPIIENMANYSFFTDRPIVSQSQEKLPEKMQYGPYTSSLSKWIGETFGVAPKKVDNFITGYTGSIGMALPKLYDMISGKQSSNLSIEEMPILRGYLYPELKSPASVEKFYKEYNEQMKLSNEYKMTKKKPEGFDQSKFKRLEEANKKLREINKQEKSIIDNPKWSVSDRRTMQKNINLKRIEIAKKALGKK